MPTVNIINGLSLTEKMSHVVKGSGLSVLWPLDNKYYPGTVTWIYHMNSLVLATIMYDDSDVEIIHLEKETFCLLCEKKVG